MHASGTKPDYASGIARAMKDIFANMFNEQALLISAAEVTGKTRVSSMVGFAGRISGFLCLHFDQKVACNLASGLLGMELEELDDTVRDAVGEIVNMLAGGLKNHLSHNEEIFKISIPSVVVGEGISTYAPADAENMMFGVAAGKNRFKVQLVVEQ
jgi:chemotaxis protein CheX